MSREKDSLLRVMNVVLKWRLTGIESVLGPVTS